MEAIEAQRLKRVARSIWTADFGVQINGLVASTFISFDSWAILHRKLICIFFIDQ